MEMVFVKLLNLSMQAGLLALAVALVRALTAKTRLPKSALVLMWGLVGLRLVCPFSVESHLSLMPSREVVRLESAAPTVETGHPALDEAPGGAILPPQREPAAPSTGAPAPAAPETPEPEESPLQTALRWAARVWPVGVGCMVLYFFVSSLLLRRRVSGAEETEEGVWESERVPSPFVFGLVRPRIYLPRGLREEHREYVLAHERAHIKRWDHLIKPLAFLILAVYWFNPLMWLAYVLLSRDIELACDERVLKDLGPRAKRPYSEALLAAVTFHRYVAACPVAFGEGRICGRVKNVLRWRKPAVWLTAASILLCGVLGACFLTDPASSDKTPDPSDDPKPSENTEPTEEPIPELAGSYKFAGDLPDRFGPNIFTVRLYGDRTFCYYETIYSSHIGMGTWAYSDGVITLTEKRQHLVGGTVVEFSEGVLQNVGGTMEDYEAQIRFRVTEDGLVYLAEGSDNFYYVEVRDGDLFLREAEAPGPTDGEREPAGTSWSFKDGVLTVSGSGPMEDYGLTEDWVSTAPWSTLSNDITSAVIEEGVTTVGSYAFFGLRNLKSVSVPSGVTAVGTGAFENTGLISVSLPQGVREIGDAAFVYCAKLSEIDLPDSVTRIGAFAFKDCAALKTVRIPAGMTEIGQGAFRESCITEIDIPSNITSIAEAAFEDCAALRRVTIPHSVRSIGAHAFAGCEALESVTIEPGVEFIGDLAFNLTYALVDITLPEGLTAMGDEVFSCSGLRSITLPASLKEAGFGLFFWCHSLADVYYGGTRERWEAIGGPSWLTYLPDTEVHID